MKTQNNITGFINRRFTMWNCTLYPWGIPPAFWCRVVWPPWGCSHLPSYIFSFFCLEPLQPVISDNRNHAGPEKNARFRNLLQLLRYCHVPVSVLRCRWTSTRKGGLQPAPCKGACEQPPHNCLYDSDDPKPVRRRSKFVVGVSPFVLVFLD